MIINSDLIIVLQPIKVAARAEGPAYETLLTDKEPLDVCNGISTAYTWTH